MNEEIEFNDLVFKALDHAIDSVKDGSILIPFVMTPTNLQRFVTDQIEEGKVEAEKYIDKQKDELLIVLAYDGFIMFENNKDHAIFVKGLNRNKKKKLLFAQHYVPATSSQSFKIVGNPILVEQVNLE